MLIDEMKTVVLRSDPKEMVEWFANRTTAERSKLAKPMRKFENDLSWKWRTDGTTRRKLKAEIAELGFDWKNLPEFNEGDPVFNVALLATQPASELKKLNFWFVTDKSFYSNELTASNATWNAAMLQVLKDRKLEKIDEVIDSLLASNQRDSGGTIQPEFLLRAIEDGVVSQPDSEDYLHCLASMLDPRWHEPNEMKRQHELLIRNGAFLQRDAYRLLQLDSDIFVDSKTRKWTDFINKLSKVGKLDRSKVLQSATRAMYADVKQNVLRGFVRLLEALEPTPSEMLALSKDLSGLLGSQQSVIGKFAFTQIKAMHADGRIDTPALLELLPPVFACPTKGLPKSAITWIRKLAKANDECVPNCVAPMMSALSHDNAEIQAAALQWLSSVKDRLHDDHLIAIRDVIASLAATNRAAAKAIVGESTNPDAQQQQATQPSEITSTPIASARELKRIVPIADHETLIDEIARTIEVTEDGNDAERVFEAISRLGPVPEALGDRAAPVLAAVMAKELWPDGHNSGSRSLCEAPDATPRVRRILCFALGLEVPKERPQTVDSEYAHALAGQKLDDAARELLLCNYEPNMEYDREFYPNGKLNYSWRSRILWQRMEALEDQLREGIALPMLASPTHEHGWIEPSVLIDRLVQWNEANRQPAEVDFLLALMRLLPDRRAVALKRVAELAASHQPALRLALDDDPNNVLLNETVDLAWLNVAAHVRCQPIASDQISRLGLDAGYVCGGLPLIKDWRANEKMPLDPMTREEYAIPYVAINRHENVWIADHPVLSEIHRIDLLGASLSQWKVHTDAWNCPRALDPYWCSAMTAQISRRGKNASIYEPNFSFLEALFNPHAVWSSTACGAVIFSLVGKDNDASRVGIDVLCEAISVGKPTSETMLEAMTRVFVAPWARVKLFAENYAQVAEASQYHRQFVRQTLGDLISFWCSPTPPLAKFHFNRLGKATDCTPVLDLYAQCLAELNQSPTEQQRAMFASVATKGKVAKVMKALIDS